MIAFLSVFGWILVESAYYCDGLGCLCNLVRLLVIVACRWQSVVSGSLRGIPTWRGGAISRGPLVT